MDGGKIVTQRENEAGTTLKGPEYQVKGGNLRLNALQIGIISFISYGIKLSYVLVVRISFMNKPSRVSDKHRI